MPRRVVQFAAVVSGGSGSVVQVASEHSSQWPISKSTAMFAPSEVQPVKLLGPAVIYSGWKSNAVVVQSVRLALCLKPQAGGRVLKGDHDRVAVIQKQAGTNRRSIRTDKDGRGWLVAVVDLSRVIVLERVDVKQDRPLRV
jgi:hypothetical protein